ncbi:DUF1330 domain-containing protein [Planctobacterium marinum]|uniref:DUF1330 domain-containing protein n=1 Tax=Planctobacterium marinum TaxID=1631968 RepID=A0AA48KS68_9ALTE|nr:hypothetical protein MACH26_38190 [Planctobacterium marinum]
MKNRNWLMMLLVLCVCSAGVKAGESAINFAPGAAMQVIVAIGKENAEDIRREYYNTAIPLARSYGFSTVARLKVDKSLVGNITAPVIVIGKWEDVDRWQAFQNDPRWPALKAMRAKGWQQLDLFTKALDSSLALNFSPDKFYTLAFASFNPEHPGDYTKYLHNIQAPLGEAGGKFIHKMIQPGFDTHSESAQQVSQITLVEWDSAEGLQQLLTSPDYLKHKHLLETGVTDFAFLRVSAMD